MAKTQRLSILNKKGINLSARLELPDHGSPTHFGIYTPCFTCGKNVISATTISRTLADLGYGILRFDFTGLYDSEGDFGDTTFTSNIEDISSMADYLKKNFKEPQLLIGHSLGGAAVLKGVVEIPSIKALVTIAAPSEASHVIHLFQSNIEDIEKAGKSNVTLHGRDFSIGANFIEDIKKSYILEKVCCFQTPLLIFHSPIDETVSIDHAAKIFQTAKHPKSFISLDQANHLLTNKEDNVYIANCIHTLAKKYLQE